MPGKLQGKRQTPISYYLCQSDALLIVMYGSISCTLLHITYSLIVQMQHRHLFVILQGCGGVAHGKIGAAILFKFQSEKGHLKFQVYIPYTLWIISNFAEQDCYSTWSSSSPGQYHSQKTTP